MAGVAGRVALITGAGSAEGIGFAIARALRDAGARVAITATTARIHDRAAELGVHAHIADLTRPDDVAALVASVETALGPVEILVNNAGMVQTGEPMIEADAADMGDAEWYRVMELNLMTAVRTTRACLPAMRKAGRGRVVMMSSVTGPMTAIAGQAAYGAGKSAMMGLVRGLALEEGPRGITVNGVGPGWIATASSLPEEIIAGNHTPIGRPGTPAEVAHAVLMLAADEAGYMTGQLVVVDGGNTIQDIKVAL